MPLTRRRVTSAAELKALGHPLRLELLDLLMRGPLTATQAAEALGQTPANVSWHLRRLAEQGFVRPAADRGPGRRRPWKVVAESSDEPRRDDVVATRDGQIRLQRDVRGAEQGPAASGTGVRRMLLVSETQYSALVAEIEAMVARFEERGAKRDERPRWAVLQLSWAPGRSPTRAD